MAWALSSNKKYRLAKACVRACLKVKQSRFSSFFFLEKTVYQKINVPKMKNDLI